MCKLNKSLPPLLNHVLSSLLVLMSVYLSINMNQGYNERMLDRDVITSVSIFPFGAHQPSPPSSAHPPEVPTLVPSSSAPSSRKPPQVSTPSSLGLSTVSSSLTSSGIDSTTDPLKPASIIPSTTSASITSADQTSKSPDKDTRVTDVEIKAAICGHDETCLASADNDWDDGAYITTRDIHGGVIFRQRRSDGMLVFDDSVHAFNLWGPGRQGFVENGQRSEQRPRHGHKQRQREGQRRSQDKRGQRASRHSKETNAGLAPDADTDIQLQPKTDGNPGRQSSNDTATGIHSAQFLRPVVLMELQPIPVTGWNVKSLNIMCYLPLHGYYPLLLRHPERYDEVLRRAHRTVFDDQPCMQRVRDMLNEQQELSNALFDIAYTQRGLTIYKDEENANAPFRSSSRQYAALAPFSLPFPALFANEIVDILAINATQRLLLYTDENQGLSVEKCVQLASYDAIFTPSTFNKHNLELYGFNTEGDGRILCEEEARQAYHTHYHTGRVGERAADLADDYDNSDHGDSSDNGTDQRPRRSSPSSFPPIPIATRSPRVFLALEGAEPALFLSKHSPRHAAATHVIANGVKDTAIAAKASVSKPESTSIPPIEGGSGALPSSEMDGVFVIYSGGKLEYRKGHDLLIAAFAKFILVHPSVDIKLMVSWHSLWKKARFETSMLYSAYTRGYPQSTDRKGLLAWLAFNGIPSRYVIVKQGVQSQTETARIMREEVDLAVFTNRGEAGTNLVAMEAMMSGVPCIITNCTGHVDLLNIDPPPSFFHDRLSEPSDADTESGGTSEDGLDANVDHSGNNRHSNTAGARTHAHPYAFVIGGDDLSPELCMHQNIGKAERRQFLQERKEGLLFEPPQCSTAWQSTTPDAVYAQLLHVYHAWNQSSVAGAGADGTGKGDDGGGGGGGGGDDDDGVRDTHHARTGSKEAAYEIDDSVGDVRRRGSRRYERRQKGQMRGRRERGSRGRSRRGKGREVGYHASLVMREYFTWAQSVQALAIAMDDVLGAPARMQ